MPTTFFEGIFDSHYSTVITVEKFLLCLGVSLGLGLVLGAALLGIEVLCLRRQ